MKSLCSALLGLSLLAIPSVQGMEAIKKHAAKATAKKLFSHAMTGIHWGLTTIPFWAVSYGHGKMYYWEIDEKLAKMGDAPAGIQKFVHGELKKSGVEHADSIPVKQENLGMLWAAFFDKAIAIDTNDETKKYPGCNVDSLQKALAGNSAEDVEVLNVARYFIHHEAGHLKSNDGLKRVIAFALAPLAIYAATKGLLFGRLKLFQKLGREIPQPSYSIGKSLLKLPSALAKIVATCLPLSQYFQQQEWAADEHVPAQKELLNAGKKCFLTIEEQSEHAKAMKQYPALQFFQVHPSNAARIARLEERIAELDVQESQQKQL